MICITKRIVKLCRTGRQIVQVVLYPVKGALHASVLEYPTAEQNDDGVGAVEGLGTCPWYRNVFFSCPLVENVDV